MTFNPVVGEAEVVIRANTAGFATEMKAQTDPALAGLGTDAAVAGEDAGVALSAGMSRGTKTLGEDATKKLETETGKMQGVLGDFRSKWQNTLQGFGVPASLTTGPRMAVLAGAAVAAVTLKMASDMQTATTAISNSEGITTKAATTIGDAMLATGGKSEFSGIQQAQAFATVAGELKATQGQALTTAQSLQFMGTAADLASAKQIDLGTATTVLGGVMQAFQIDTNGAADAANTLYNASNITGVAIDSLASSLERVRSRLGTMAPPLKDLTALIVDLTKQGITGRGALTALQGSYSALAGAATGTTKANLEAKKLFSDYGIQVVDASGKLTSMAHIIDVLGPKFATMSQAQQLQTATILFGASAAKQMTTVIDAGTQAYAAASDAVTKHNALQQAAAAQAKTLSAQWKIIKSDLSDMAVSIGALLIPAFTGLLHIVLPVIDAFAHLVTWFTQGSTPAIALAGVIGAILVPSLVKIGVEATASAAKAVAAFVSMGWSALANITKIDASLGLGEIKMAGFATTVEAEDASIVAANEAAGASFTAMLGPIAAVAAAGVAAFVITTKLLDKLKEMATVNPTGVLGQGTTSQEQIVREYFKAHGQSTASLDVKGNVIGTGTFKAADEWYKKMEAEKKKKAAEALKGVSGDQFIAPPVTTKTTAAHKSAGTTAANKAAAASLKAQNTLTSETLTALKLPYAEGVHQLELLGVPAKKAALVLHDAVLPFNDAVKALEKAGFDAANAVKIADAERKKKTKAPTKGTSSNPTGIMVNGIEVSGAVYDAAIGAAMGLKPTNRKGTSTVGGAPTPGSYGYVGGPAATKSPPTINIAPGAIVVNPAPGNDAKSLLVTHAMLEELLVRWTTEVQAGQTSLSLASA
jgi:TP901 family phage tail tape measure protein